jgi:hypothetical protein
MPRPKGIPSYCVHSRSGPAFVIIDGRQIPLGKADNDESRTAYPRALNEWAARGHQSDHDAFHEMIDIRYASRTATLMLTNLEHDEIPDYFGKAILSRINHEG